MRSFARSAAAMWLAAFILLSAVPVIRAEIVKSDSPAQRWKFTDHWHLVVEYFAPSMRQGAEPPKPSATFTVEVEPITDPEETDEDGWTILRFTAASEAPEQLRPLMSAWVLKGAGWLGGAMRTYPDKPVPVDMKILQMGYVSVLLEPDLGMPVEMLFPNLPSQTLTDPRTKTVFELRRQEKDGLIHMEATFRILNQDEIRLRQTWGKGDTWWRESTRYVNGRKTCHAKFVSYHSTAQLEQRLRQDINLFLEDDDRLDVRFDFVRDNPSAQELLDAVQKASGVRLHVDTELRDHEAPFGSVHFRDAPTWMVMKFIAEDGFHRAQWERDGGGYRLRNTSLAAVPKTPLAAVPKTPVEHERTDFTSWLLVLVASSLIVLLVVVFLLRKASRRNGRVPAKKP